MSEHDEEQTKNAMLTEAAVRAVQRIADFMVDDGFCERDSLDLRMIQEWINDNYDKVEELCREDDELNDEDAERIINGFMPMLGTFMIPFWSRVLFPNEKPKHPLKSAAVVYTLRWADGRATTINCSADDVPTRSELCEFFIRVTLMICSTMKKTDIDQRYEHESGTGFDIENIKLVEPELVALLNDPTKLPAGADPTPVMEALKFLQTIYPIQMRIKDSMGNVSSESIEDTQAIQGGWDG